MKHTTRNTIAGVAALAAGFGIAGTANAAHDDNPSKQVASYSYELNPVQGDTVANSQATGTTRVKALPNGKLQVKVEAWGVAPGLPHAMHLHGIAGGGDNGCPSLAAGADTSGDGIVTVLEGAPFYGGIRASLLNTGDPLTGNPLDLPDFAVADADGHLEYSRTFAGGDVTADAGNVQVVVHGIDINANGEYDFEAGPSSLGAAFPLEATVPVLCGGIAN